MRKFLSLSLLLGATMLLSSCAKHEHTTGDWKYSETHHWRITTCKQQMCDIDPLLEEHIDSDNNHICDVCNYEISHEHTTEWGWSEECHWFYYTCGCPSNDIAELHTDYDEDNVCDICGYARRAFLREFEPWLLDLTAENVVQIKTTQEYIGVAPGAFKNILRTTDKTNIENILNAYKSITFTRNVPREEAEIDGGGAFTIEFLFGDGTKKSLYFNNGNYRYDKPELSSLLFFEPSDIPNLTNHENIEYSYSFVTYQDVGALYVYDTSTEPATATELGEFPNVGALEFVYTDVSYPTQPTHYLETEFGDLYIVSQDTFYIQSGCDISYFRLIDNVFYEIGI